MKTPNRQWGRPRSIVPDDPSESNTSGESDRKRSRASSGYDDVIDKYVKLTSLSLSHNKRQLEETIRRNGVMEQLAARKLEKTKRHNMVMERRSEMEAKCNELKYRVELFELYSDRTDEQLLQVFPMFQDIIDALESVKKEKKSI